MERDVLSVVLTGYGGFDKLQVVRAPLCFFVSSKFSYKFNTGPEVALPKQSKR
jgi:hypothetical protein